MPKPRDAGRDPYAPLESDGPGVAAWRRRMGGEAAKAVYKQRAATAECAKGVSEILCSSGRLNDTVRPWLA